ncbi:LysR family transcriptional regulator [Novacetimonas hansenii]|uniref:LysR family transcriptional regulator n=1 Tax=Novacetimonas hansenii TaxID=436 RepID=UPI001785E899|nr:LysR substrate-binding domain-containing protein [Novacetimonas hansenii]MBL7235904.1 LysR family transcriptional regulator [Novacetimonas hansenii]QOF94511.1 LysR family transcriptional regulator [Novacetimonas hansenii]
MLSPICLRSFLVVIDMGGFTEAARHLNATQSTISGHIKRLEEQAGHRLLDRDRGGSVALTAQGRDLIGYAREILRLEQAARSRLAGTSLTGAVRIGLPDDFASGRGFTHLLADFAGQHPDARLEVEVGNSDYLISALDAQRLDHVLTKQTRSADGEVLAQRAIVWAGRISSTGPVSLVLFPEPCTYRQRAIRKLEEEGFFWNITYVSPSLTGILAAVNAGLGVSPLAEDLTEELVPSIPGRLLPSLGSVDLVLHSRRGRLSHAAGGLGDLIRKHYGIANIKEKHPSEHR